MLYREDGGAEGSRTPDLLIANETLYQLSYDPIHGADVDTLGIDESWRNYEVGRATEKGGFILGVPSNRRDGVNILVIILLPPCAFLSN